VISLQRLNYTPDSTLRAVGAAQNLTREQREHLIRATLHTFVVYLDDRVIALFGLADEVLLSTYYGVWVTFAENVTIPVSALRWIKCILDQLSKFYSVELRASVATVNATNIKFVEFCGFVCFGRIGSHSAYERKIN